MAPVQIVKSVLHARPIPFEFLQNVGTGIAASRADEFWPHSRTCYPIALIKAHQKHDLEHGDANTRQAQDRSPHDIDERAWNSILTALLANQKLIAFQLEQF
jgi:hypothetical protein